METYSNRVKINLTVNHHGVMMHNIAEGTFIGNRLLWYAFTVTVIFCRNINNVVLMGKYHILSGNKADEQYF